MNQQECSRVYSHFQITLVFEIKSTQLRLVLVTVNNIETIDNYVMICFVNDYFSLKRVNLTDD